jgi:hypothetical protein
MKKQGLKSVRNLEIMWPFVESVTQILQVSYFFHAGISLLAKHVKLYSKLVQYVERQKRMLLRFKI